MRTILKTGRLLLRELESNDHPFILELLNSPGWLQYIGDKHVHTEQQAKQYIENGPQTSYRENGFGLWLAEAQPGGEAVGLCGLLKRSELEHPDIGFALLPGAMGQGYALEMASAVLSYAHNTLMIPTVLAICMPGNLRSVRLLEKIGLHYLMSIRLAHSEEDLSLYSVSS